MSGPKPMPLRKRIFANMEVECDGCWNWTGYINPEGYGRIKVKGTTHNAHRIAYRVLVGEFDPSLHVDHLCRNRRCVNPLHLEPVTARENQMRGPGSITHCKRGHLLSGDNLQERADGRRICRACHRVLALASYYRCRYGDGGSRTHKVLPPPDFEPGAFTSLATSPSATGADEEATP